MKKNKIHLKLILTVFLPCLLMMLSGCEKKLEIVPPFVAVEDNALGTVDGIDAGIRAAYFQQQNSFSTVHILWAELMSDELKYRPAVPFPNYQNYYDRNLRAVAEETPSATDIRGVNNVKQKEIYNSINYASLILRSAINDVAKADIDFAANKNRIMGECYFLRAIGNFQLLRFFAKPWGATADNAHPGIIINEQPVDDRVSQVKARATVAQVYAFIIDDLIKAEGLLPESYLPGVHPSGYNGRAYKDAARSILARVYFQQQNYGKAKEMIDKVIGATVVSADPTVANNLTRHPLAASCEIPFTLRGPVADLVNDENIWSDVAALTANGHVGAWWNSAETLYKTWTFTSVPAPATVNGVASSTFIAQAKFSMTAEANGGNGIDQRRTKCFAVLSTGELMPGKYAYRGEQINIPLIRSAELVLDRAEINAMDNNLTAAINDLNVTRNRAGLKKLSATMTQPAVLDSVCTERLRELCFEGDRLWNLKRLKLPVGPGDRAGAAPLPWDGLETVLKFFLAEQDKNPLLINNY